METELTKKFSRMYYMSSKEKCCEKLQGATRAPYLVHSLHSFIHSGYLYSASSSPLLLRALPIQHGYCIGVSRRSTTGNCKGWLERDLNPRPSGQQISTLTMSHLAPQICTYKLCTSIGVVAQWWSSV